MKVSVYQLPKTKSLCSSRRRIRLAVIADVHNGVLAAPGSPLIREIDQRKPDAVLCCGDLVIAGRREVHTDLGLRLMKELAGRYPVYMVNGNHESRLQQRPQIYGAEHLRWFDEIRSCGVHLLQNTCEILEIRDARIAVYGFELPLRYYQRSRYRELPLYEIRETLGDPDPEVYTLLLAHHPDYAKVYAGWGADAALAGHVHGGIVRLPLLGGVIGAHFTPFPKYTRGLYRISAGEKQKAEGQGMPLIVSAGLGEHTIPLRFNNPRELVMLEYI